MFVKLALSFEPLNISGVESRNLGLWQQTHLKEEEGGEKKDKHTQCFPFRVHYSADPG